jgi:hypothetical protein
LDAELLLDPSSDPLRSPVLGAGASTPEERVTSALHQSEVEEPPAKSTPRAHDRPKSTGRKASSGHSLEEGLSAFQFRQLTDPRSQLDL